MFTVILAFINAKYGCGHEVLFLGTVIIDIVLLCGYFNFRVEMKDENE